MLTERQTLILRMVVDDYVRSAEPVGSRTLSKHTELGLSAATVRNAMADLEEQGFLEQPHASAGRIPSQTGYRYYVDHFISPDSRLSVSEINEIKSLYSERISEIERIAQQTALMISSLTHYTGVVLGPRVYDTTLKSLQLISLNEKTGVLLVVTSSGQVQNKTVTFPEGIVGGDVEGLVRILNAKLQGIPMFRIRSRVMEEITREVARHVGDYEESIRLLDQIMNVVEDEPDDRLFMGGATNMLLQPEFRDVDKVTPVLSWLEQRNHVIAALQLGSIEELEGEGVPPPKVSIRIGGENFVQTLQDCSLITATYELGGVPVGVLGVIGPTRMEYGRVIRLLRHLSNGLTDVYTKLYGG